MHRLVILTIILVASACGQSTHTDHDTAVQVQDATECLPCDRTSCVAPRNCLAGMVKDSCDCCYLCGNREGQRCEHPELNSGKLGKCGDNLECRIRSDLHWDDPPEAVCVCKRNSPLCGSDGVTYDTMCQLTEARYTRRDGLRAVSSGPCINSPVISAPPQDVHNTTGSYAAFTCEVKAWPVATIHWEKLGNQGTLKLPGNDSRLAVQSRIGPNKDETTSWLLFLSLSKEDEGTYRCKAENDVGSATETARVSVTG